MQRRKGFTLVELVIVIAVIAILAGVLIGTFASVINKANESAKMQEMKAAEHEQKANDILNKLNNAQWFGWEDLETKIGEAIQQAISQNLSQGAKDAITQAELDATKVAIINAVDQAIAKYAQAQGQDNTQLTAEQVKYIVEQAVSKSGGVTEAQVKAIVTSALQGVSTLNANQIQRIADAAVNRITAAGLTAADLASALAKVTNKDDYNSVLTAIENATKGLSTLTEKEIVDIVSRYVKATGETKGDYTWITSETELNMPASEAALQALSVLSKNGETFKGQTIKITEIINNNATAGNPSSSNEKVIELHDKWIPIQYFEGTLDGDGYEIKGINVEVVYWASNDIGSTGVTYITGTGADEPGWFGERKAFGFIGALGGTVKNLTLNYNTDFVDPKAAYTVFGGVAGNVIFGSQVEINNVTVTGTINGYQCIGGLLGTIHAGEKSKVVQPANTEPVTTVKLAGNKVEAVISTKQSEKADGNGHVVVSGLIGELNMNASLTSLEVTDTNTCIKDNLTSTVAAQVAEGTYSNSSTYDKNHYKEDWAAQGNATKALTISELVGTKKLVRSK